MLQFQLVTAALGQDAVFARNTDLEALFDVIEVQKAIRKWATTSAVSIVPKRRSGTGWNGTRQERTAPVGAAMMNAESFRAISASIKINPSINCRNSMMGWPPNRFLENSFIEQPLQGLNEQFETHVNQTEKCKVDPHTAHAGAAVRVCEATNDGRDDVIASPRNPSHYKGNCRNHFPSISFSRAGESRPQKLTTANWKQKDCDRA